MRKVSETHRRYLPLGLAGALLIALGLVIGGLLWANQASAERGVVLIHVQKDGTDYKGNPQCPGNGQPVNALGQASTIAAAERAIDDCNNLIGTTHLIRTEGFLAATMVPTPTAAPWAIMAGRPGQILLGNPAMPCSDPAFAPYKGASWDVTNNAELCVLITSSEPGETSITFGYTYTATPTPAPTTAPTSTPSPTPTPPLAGFNLAGPIVKEWNKLDHTEIWQLACTNPLDPVSCTAADQVGAGDLTGETFVGTSMVDMEFDTANDRLRGLKRLREIVWGWHGDPDAPGDIVVPVEGARVTVMIDNNEDGVPDTFNAGTCAFFTNYNGSQAPPAALTPQVLTGVTQTHKDGTVIVTHAVFGSLDDIYVDTTCKETTTIRIKVEYPAGIFSIPGVIWEKTKILWQEKEVGKQPQIRWAGEKIVLAKRWALPEDFYYPNKVAGIPERGDQCLDNIDNGEDTPPDGLVNDGCPAVGVAESGNQCLNAIDDLEDATPDEVVNDGCPTNTGGFAGVCPHAGKIVQYNKESGDGGLTTGLPDLIGPLSNEPDRVSTIVDAECISRAMYESEEQGENNIKVLLLDFAGGVDAGEATLQAATVDGLASEFQDMSNACITTYNASTKTATDLTTLNTCLATVETEYMSRLATEIRFPGFLVTEEKQDAFLVWYLKIYQVKLENVPLTDNVGRELHNAGTWSGEDPLDLTNGVTAETLNVSQDALARVVVKGWFYSGNNSGRSDVCVDIDGDGDGIDNDGDTLLNEDPADGVDNDGDTKIDEDTEVAGQPYKTTTHEGCADPDDEALDHGYWVLPDDMAKLAGPNWQVTKANWDVMSEADEAGSVTGGAFVGPKSSLDSHDDIARPWVPFFGTALRKTVDPDGQLTAADAIMPPLKLTAMIDDPSDAGFLKQADKGDDVGITSLYQSIMLGADPEISQLGETGGGTYGYEINSWIQGPYEFYHIFLSALSLLADCPDLDGELCNANIGNQIDQSPWDENHPRLIQLYSDNRGLAYFFANGDYNLSFDECPIQQYSETPFCSPGDVVGLSDITVTGDYPYFRKHSSVESNVVEKTWTWDGFKSVTAEKLDATHTRIIAHLQDRDGYCKWDVGDDPTKAKAVVFSPSEHEVQHEWIEFLLNDAIGYIREVSPNSLYDGDVLDDHSIINIGGLIGMPISEIVKILDHVHAPLADEASTGLEDGFVSQAERAAAARAEDVRVLGFYGESAAVDPKFTDPDAPDECQAWVVIEHPADQTPNVSVVFHDPEGRIDLHYPTSKFVSILNQGWNDSCYTGPELNIEEVLTDAGLIEADGTSHVLAVYRFTNDDTQAFDHWFPGRPELNEGEGAITTIAPYDQLFLLMDSPMSWTMDTVADTTGQKDTQVSLIQNWSSVCYAGADKAPEEAAASINNNLVIMYTLASDQTWRRYVPNRAELTNIITLNQYTSVFTLMTNAGIWVFDP